MNEKVKAERKKLLDRGLWENWELADEYECAITCDYLDIFEGYAAMTKVDKAAFKVVYNRGGEEICILDDGYIWIHVLPMDKNYTVLLMMDADMNVVQWYFDITAENGIDEEGNPYFTDMYLDLVLYPDGGMAVLDEDELNEALEKGDIDLAEAGAARAELERLKEYLAANFDELKEKSDRYIAYFASFV